MQYAVLGQPIEHSRSPQIHALFAQEEGADIVYGKIGPAVADFESAVQAFWQQGGLGANVTVPFKERAFALADCLTERAKAAGAVNTLILQCDGQNNSTVIGDNTDGAGLVWDITKRLNVSLTGKKILIIGAGGAVRGVLLPILAENPQQVVICNRTHAKALTLAVDFGIEASLMADLTCSAFDVVINATSSGLSQALPNVPDTVFAGAQLAYDLVYGEHAQAFLSWAKRHGAQQAADGLGMLVGQAAESYFQWRGFRPSIAPVIAELLKG